MFQFLLPHKLVVLILVNIHCSHLIRNTKDLFIHIHAWYCRSSWDFLEIYPKLEILASFEYAYYPRIPARCSNLWIKSNTHSSQLVWLTLKHYLWVTLSKSIEHQTFLCSINHIICLFAESMHFYLILTSRTMMNTPFLHLMFPNHYILVMILRYGCHSIIEWLNHTCYSSRRR